jgi:Na+/H+ antiporter NhaD/arsenite permease-like protein
MVLTNDVALFLVIPFTLLFTRVAKIDLATIVVLEISSANVVGSLTPVGNPQNLFLYGRGGFSPASFVQAQLPIVAVGALLLSGAAWRLLPRTPFQTPDASVPAVDRLRAAAFAVLLAAEAASILGAIAPAIPLALAGVGAVLLGRRLREIDFSLVLVFAFLFVGVAGLERSGLYAVADPRALFGGGSAGLLVSGALLSQIVSNVPAAMLLAPAASGPAGFQALLRGVTVGGCGTPLASIANLIGAQLYLQSGAPAGRFWKLFAAVSGLLLVLLLGFALGWTRLTGM